MAYYTLVSNSDGEIRIEFGSYDRADCVSEIDAMVDDYGSSWRRKDFKIIKTENAKAGAVSAAVEAYRNLLGETINEFNARRAKAVKA